MTHLRLHSCYLHGKRSTATFVKPATPGLSPLPANWEARGRERGEEGGGEVKAGVAEGKEEREVRGGEGWGGCDLRGMAEVRDDG